MEASPCSSASLPLVSGVCRPGLDDSVDGANAERLKLFVVGDVAEVGAILSLRHGFPLCVAKCQPSLDAGQVSDVDDVLVRSRGLAALEERPWAILSSKASASRPANDIGRYPSRVMLQLCACGKPGGPCVVILTHSLPSPHDLKWQSGSGE